MLPLIQTSCTAVAIDDDASFVEMLESVLRPRRFLAFSQPKPFERALTRTLQLLDAEQHQFHAVVDAQRREDCTAVQRMLRYFACADRFDIASVAFFDYSMPWACGLEMIARYKHPGLQRVLLTGDAGSDIAIDAFNASEIEGYVRKLPYGGVDLLALLGRVIEKHHRDSTSRRGESLAAALPQWLLHAFRDSGFSQSLADLLSTLDIVEYAFLGRPCGLIAHDAGGRAVWIQLEDESSMASLPQLLAEASPCLGALDMQVALEAVGTRAATVNIDMPLELPGTRAMLAPLRVLSASPEIWAAVFPLDDLPVDLVPMPGPPAQLRRWGALA